MTTSAPKRLLPEIEKARIRKRYVRAILAVIRGDNDEARSERVVLRGESVQINPAISPLYGNVKVQIRRML